MKKIISSLVTCAIYAAIFPGYATAQNLKDYSSPPTNEAGYSNTATKNKVVAPVDPVTKTEIKSMKTDLKMAKANYRATENFNSNFKNVTGVQWTTEKDAITASFPNYEGVRSRVVYDKKGNWLHTILNYHEQDLDGDVKSLVKKNFNGYNIKLVQEIMEGDVKLYKIHLENDKSLKQVLVCEGEITEYQEFNRGS